MAQGMNPFFFRDHSALPSQSVVIKHKQITEAYFESTRIGKHVTPRRSKSGSSLLSQAVTKEQKVPACSSDSDNKLEDCL